jgi:LAO/AO transport system kinase
MARRPDSARPNPDVAKLAAGIRTGERAVLARAITLIESRRADHQRAARALVQEVLPLTGQAVRVGITGMPGVGKSTTIDALGVFLTNQGHKVAVLTVDPSSSRSGGSILGDKTRMARLANDPHLYISAAEVPALFSGVPDQIRKTISFVLTVCELFHRRRSPPGPEFS